MASELAANSGSTLITVALAAVFIGVGLFMLFRLYSNFRKAEQSKNWMTTTGKVLFSDVDVQYSSDSDGDTSKTYGAKVVYEYDVVGMHYEKDRIAFNAGVRSSNYKKHSAIAAAYPVGKTVTVYFNPDDPDDAVLETKVDSVASSVIIAIICIAIGLVIISTTLTGS